MSVLDLKKQQITADSLSELASAGQFKGVTELDLIDNYLSERVRF
jgi:hypothetical protein